MGMHGAVWPMSRSSTSSLSAPTRSARTSPEDSRLTEKAGPSSYDQHRPSTTDAIMTDGDGIPRMYTSDVQSQVVSRLEAHSQVIIMEAKPNAVCDLEAKPNAVCDMEAKPNAVCDLEATPNAVCDLEATPNAVCDMEAKPNAVCGDHGGARSSRLPLEAHRTGDCTGEHRTGDCTGDHRTGDCTGEHRTGDCTGTMHTFVKEHLQQRLYPRTWR